MEQSVGRIPGLFEARRESHLVCRVVLALFVQIDRAEQWGNVGLIVCGNNPDSSTFDCGWTMLRCSGSQAQGRVCFWGAHATDWDLIQLVVVIDLQVSVYGGFAVRLAVSQRETPSGVEDFSRDGVMVRISRSTRGFRTLLYPDSGLEDADYRRSQSSGRLDWTKFRHRW